MRNSSTWLLAALLAVAGTGLTSANQQERQQINPQERQQQEHTEHGKHEIQLPDQGVVILRATKGNKARGILRLIQEGDNLHVRGIVANLSPGMHGFHIHEYGDLRESDGTSAGGHFNPHGHEHGAPGANSHIGDLGNIEANEQGTAQVNMVVQNVPLHFILGRSFVVHAGKDDLTSQPSGDAGPRVAVGVIGVANPEIKQLLPNDGNNNRGNGGNN